MTNRSISEHVKTAFETIRMFVNSRPSPITLWRNRTSQFKQIHPILPSTAEVGAECDLTLQARDQCERLHRNFTGKVTLESTDPDAEFPKYCHFTQGMDGVQQLDGIRFQTPGIQYLLIHHEASGNRFVSNPVRVAEDFDRRVFWGDIHIHSYLSDGTGPAERGYRFGRDIMDLDVVAYTDHDTMGFFIPPSWQQKRMHQEFFPKLCTLSDEFNDPGEFVTLPGYEWTKQPNKGGHINVYFDDSEAATLFDSISPESNTYRKLWDRLREWDQGHEANVITIPHHPAEAMYPFDFAGTEYDDELAPLVEVYSQWGSSEMPGDAGNRYPLKLGQGEINRDGYYVQDAHQLGYKVGMLGGSDYHGPHPGHALIHTAPHFPSLSDWLDKGIGWSNIWRVWNERSYPGGLTAFLTAELTRDDIFSALQHRSVYATTQPDRILIDFTINGNDVADQTEAVTVQDSESVRELSVSVAGTAPIAEITILKNNTVWEQVEGTNDPAAPIESFTHSESWEDTAPIDGMAWNGEPTTDGDVYTLRVTQASEDAFPGMAWVGPIWVEAV